MSEQDSKNLNVLFLTSWYPNPENPIEGTFVREFVKAVRLRNEAAIIHLAGSAGNRLIGVHQFETIEDELPPSGPALRVFYRDSPVPKTSYLLYISSAIAAFRRVLKRGFRPDIIHAHTHSAGVAAVLIGAIYGLPVVVSEHSSAFPEHRLNRFELLKAGYAFSRAKAVLPVSAFLQRAIEDLGLHASFRIVPNAVDTNIFRPPPATNVGSETARLLFVGQLSPVKGFPLLVNALGRLPPRFDWHLDVIGDGPSRNDYQRLALETGLTQKITFHGILSKAEVANLMRQGSALVVASRTETQSCVVIEAMASGLPVVATAVGGIPETLTEGAGLLVAPNDAMALSRGIITVLRRAPQFRHPAVVQSARARFSHEAVGKILAQTYWEFVHRTRTTD